MTRKQPGFWEIIQADRVRYFGPNPPEGRPRDPLTGLLVADNSASSAATPTDSDQAPADNSSEASTPGAPGDGFQVNRSVASTPGIAGPMGDSPITGADVPDVGGLSPAPLDLPPLGDISSGDGPEAAGIDPSTASPAPLVAPSTRISKFAAAMSAAANRSLAIGQAIMANAAKDVLPLLPDTDAPELDNTAPQSPWPTGARASAQRKQAANRGFASNEPDGRSSAAWPAGQAPTLNINVIADDRLTKIVLESVSQKMERFVFNHARHEVERGFHMYQANLRALFRNLPS